MADRHFSDIRLWHTEQFGGSFPASLPALGSYRDVATAAPCGPEDNPVAAFCGLSPQRKLMNCCSLTWAGRGTLCVLTCALRHQSLMSALSQHWHGEGCCFLSPGSLNAETIWRLLWAGDFLKDGRMATERQILLGFYLQTCYSRHSRRGGYLGTGRKHVGMVMLATASICLMV